MPVARIGDWHELSRALAHGLRADPPVLEERFREIASSVDSDAPDAAEMKMVTRFTCVLGLLSIDAEEARWGPVLDDLWDERWSDAYQEYMNFHNLGFSLSWRKDIRALAALARCEECLHRLHPGGVPPGLVADLEKLRAATSKL